MAILGRRRWKTRWAAAAVMVVSTAAFHSGGAAHARAISRYGYYDAYNDLGYYSDYSDYGGYYSPYSSYTYDPGATCYGVVCDGGFSDPATNYLYDSSEASLAASTDSADAFDAYIRETAPPIGASGAAAALAGPSTYKAVGTLLTTLTSAPAAATDPAIAGVANPRPMTAAGSGQARLQVGQASRSSLLLSHGPASWSSHVALNPLLASAAVSANSVSTFVDTQRTYKINFPTEWTMVNHDQYVRGSYVDARLISPDANVGVVGQSVTLPQGMSLDLGDPSVQNYLAGSIQFAAFGAQAAANPELQSFTIPSGDEVLVGRVPFQWVDTSLAPEQFTNVQQGGVGAVLFLALLNNNRLYVITGTIADLSNAQAVNDAKQLSGIFSSLDLIHVFTPSGKPNAIVDSTNTYRLQFPQDTWTYTKGVPKGDTALVSGSHNSAVVAVSSPAPKGMQTITSGYMNNVVGALGSTLGKVTKSPTFHKIVNKGSTQYAATLPFTRKDGKTGKAMIVATIHKKKVCAVVGIVMDTGAASVKAQAQQASYIVSSLHLQ